MTDYEKALKELERVRTEKAALEHQLTRAKNRIDNTARKQNKARTHRLIIEGAELEYVFAGIEKIAHERFCEFMRSLAVIPAVIQLYQTFVNEQKSEEKEGD